MTAARKTHGVNGPARSFAALSPCRGFFVNMIDWYKKCLLQYADFYGRARRKEFWFFALVNTLIVVAVEIVLVAAMPWDRPNAPDPSDPTALPVWGIVLWVILEIYNVAVFVPNLAVTVRRLHDTDRSGWWLLMYLLPLAGPIVMLVFLATDGTDGPNRFGPDPQADERAARAQVVAGGPPR